MDSVDSGVNRSFPRVGAARQHAAGRKRLGELVSLGRRFYLSFIRRRGLVLVGV